MLPAANRRATLIFLSVLLALSVVLGLFILQPFFDALIIATILAVSFYPLYRRLGRLTRTRNQASLLTTVCLLVAIALPITALAVAAGGEAISAARQLSERSAEQGGYVPFLTNLLSRPLAWINRHIDLSHYDLKAQLASRLEQLSVWLLKLGAAILGNLLGTLANLFLALVIAFFFFREGEQLLAWIAGLMPLTSRQSKRLLDAIGDAIVANLYAMIAVGGAQGLLTGVALSILGVSSAVLLGLAAAVCSLVPVVGPSLVWGPVAVYLLFAGRTGAGIFLALWGMLVVGTVDNIIRPLVASGKTEAHPLLLLLAMLGGVQAFGITGLFLGPVVLSIITAVLSILNEVGSTDPAEGAGQTA
jgi:predicted PurR-regulated permease PerM